MRPVSIAVMLVSCWAIHAEEPLVIEASPSILAKWSKLEASGSEAGEAAEKKDEIETDRDSFTPATTTAGMNRLIFESAWTYSDNRYKRESNSLPEALFRYGLTSRLEARLGWNYESGGVLEEPGVLERESNLSYGFKYRLTEGECWMPASAFIVQAATPTSGKTNNSQLFNTYVFGWELPHGIQLDAAMRYAAVSEQSDHFNEWAPSVVIKVALGEKIKVHVEYFSIYSTGKAENFNQQFFSPGAHYLVTDNFEIGFRVGWGLNDQSARFFSNIGLGVRF